jgi:NAD dependent epimerase/dehydratase family enzyme
MLNKIVIAGGNGFLGSLLTEHFRDKTEKIVLLARKEIRTFGNTQWKYWNGETIGDWADELEDADAVINLAGKNVNCRYTAENKKLIY